LNCYLEEPSAPGQALALDVSNCNGDIPAAATALEEVEKGVFLAQPHGAAVGADGQSAGRAALRAARLDVGGSVTRHQAKQRLVRACGGVEGEVESGGAGDDERPKAVRRLLILPLPRRAPEGEQGRGAADAVDLLEELEVSESGGGAASRVE
jgi:hypothetical protein